MSVSLLVFSYCGYPSDFSCRDSVIFYDLKQLWADSIPKVFQLLELRQKRKNTKFYWKLRKTEFPHFTIPMPLAAEQPHSVYSSTSSFREGVEKQTNKQPTITVRDLFVEFSVW